MLLVIGWEGFLLLALQRAWVEGDTIDEVYYLFGTRCHTIRWVFVCFAAKYPLWWRDEEMNTLYVHVRT